ncbi:hypothetical protein [Frisingicoccus sp.]|uniref:hypothetical protein n=1 Tax=Frisingicoccus sp. TaxID=1918627 RepID=UPI003AB78C56
MKKREWVAGKPKKKPDYDSGQITEEVLGAAVAAYRPVEGKHPSLQTIADELNRQGIKGLNPLKVRKLLITAGVYKSKTADQVLELWNTGSSVKSIQEQMRLSRASVNSYLPYSKIIYKLDEVPGGERSVNADRQKLFRDRKGAVKQMRDLLDESGDNERLEEHMWDTLNLFQGYPFLTAKGLKFTYTLKGNEIFFSRKEKSVTRAKVDLALQKAVEKEGLVSGPKKLDCFGAIYLYPVFQRLGIIKVKENIS